MKEELEEMLLMSSGEIKSADLRKRDDDFDDDEEYEDDEDIDDDFDEDIDEEVEEEEDR